MTKIDPFSVHEALDRSSVFAELIQGRLCEHTFIKSQPELLALADTAAQALYDLYQAVGQHSL